MRRSFRAHTDAGAATEEDLLEEARRLRDTPIESESYSAIEVGLSLDYSSQEYVP
ncbi:hypothetical protein AB1K56_14660 [Microbacterium sp. BWR-S6Y]|uniref:hypothetical protein n=1 Tax=Microbacterium sp. BWR-S6Y TaxID=3232073 RepID=UPI003526F375